MSLLKLLPLFFAAYGLLVVIITAALYRAMRRPARFTYGAALARGFVVEPSELGLDADELTLRDARGKQAPAWGIAGRKPQGPIVVMLHGFARSRYSTLELAPCFVPHASRLVLPDLPGHGESGTQSSSAGVTDWRDVLAFVEQVRDGEHPVVLYGRSMGAGVCVAAAARAPGLIAGVIVEGVYRDWAGPIRRRMKLRRYPAEPFVTLAGLAYRMLVSGLGEFNRVTLAAKLRCPLLVMQGTDDAVCPIEDARAVAAAAPDAELVEFPGGQHLDLHRINPDLHRESIARFFERLSATTRPHDPEPLCRPTA